MQGSCNNLCDTAPDPAEFAARSAADIAWVHETFEVARARRSAAVMMISQADPGFDLSDGTRAPVRDPKTLIESDGQSHGFHDFLVEVRTDAIAFARPVAYVHGDSHYFRTDKPLQDSIGGRLENFTRLETFGDNQANGNNDVHWAQSPGGPSLDRRVTEYKEGAMPNRVVHFEIEASDQARARDFYARAFGWQLQQMGEDMGNYVVVTTGDPKEPGGINGGIYSTPPGSNKEINAFSCVIGVDNIDTAIGDVKGAGGEVLGDKMDIPSIGTFVRCKDTEGNFFTMLQPLPM